MVQLEIIEKFKTFLSQHPSLKEECHVVYFMVELRKILDHENSSAQYPLLKFYSDWTVHIKKDYISPQMKIIIDDMYKTALSEIANPASVQTMSPVMQFAYMDGLGKEMKQFLENHDLDSSLANEEGKWIEFIQPLIKVLENQPINNPTKDVEYFCFASANPGCVIGTLKFKQPVRGYPSYTFKNAF
ncbi:MAG: hypothetical protein ABIG29_00305 [Candidatus Nealsonbacteria bacterium]